VTRATDNAKAPMRLKPFRAAAGIAPEDVVMAEVFADEAEELVEEDLIVEAPVEPLIEVVMEKLLVELDEATVT